MRRSTKSGGTRNPKSFLELTLGLLHVSRDLLHDRHLARSIKINVSNDSSMMWQIDIKIFSHLLFHNSNGIADLALKPIWRHCLDGAKEQQTEAKAQRFISASGLNKMPQNHISLVNIENCIQGTMKPSIFFFTSSLQSSKFAGPQVLGFKAALCQAKPLR